MPRINQSVETMVMNDKGEMVSKRANTVMSWGDEPSYIKLYLQDIMYLSDMPKKYVAVTEALLKRIAYAGMKMDCACHYFHEPKKLFVMN